MKKGLVSLFFALVTFLFIGNEQAQAQNQTKYFFDTNNAPQVTVMNYHHVGYAGEHPLIENIRVSPELFRKQLQALKENGYTTLTLEQFIAYLKGTGVVPKKSVLLTIDDGFQSVYNYAFPILKELDMHAVIFPITAEMERGTRKGAPMMTKAELLELVDSGVFDVGNHTHDLHWRGGNDQVGKEALIWGRTKDGKLMSNTTRKIRIEKDLQLAEKWLKKETGAAVMAISYPYGAYDSHVLSVAKDRGYQVGFTVKNGYTLFGSGADNPLEVNRIGISEKNTPDSIINRLTSYTTAAKKEQQQTKMIEVSITKKNDTFTVHTSLKKKQPFSTKIELHKTTNGIHSYVRTFSSSTFTLGEKGTYVAKVIVTLKDKSKQIEWVTLP